MIEKRDVPCDLCGSHDHKFLFDAKDKLHGCEGTFTYVQCSRCGLVYMNPQISPAEMEKFYPSDYSPHRAGQKKQQHGKLTSKSKALKRPFVASVVSRLVKGGRLLDVGCGNGSFLNEMAISTGCQVYGVDASKLAVKAAKESYQIDIFTGTIAESPFSDNYFDVITAWSYLEHVNSPSEVLAKISSLLKSDGLCIISTPNFKSFNSRLFKDKWYHLDCPRHLYIYSPDTITKLLATADMAVTDIVFERTAKSLVRSLQYHFGNDDIPFKQRRRLTGSSLLTKSLLPLTSLLALIKLSDVMVICASKLKDSCITRS